MSTSGNHVDSTARAFEAKLAEVWRVQRSEEEAIAQAYAPIADQITALLAAIARSAIEVTGKEAKVMEAKREFLVSTRGLVTDQYVTHPSGNFHVRLRYGRAGVEYHRELVMYSDIARLYALIAKAALIHFGPKPT